MRALDKLYDYLMQFHWRPQAAKFQGGPGSVVLNAPEEDRELFRQLKSDDVKDFVNNGLAVCMSMSEQESKQDQFNRENKSLMERFDREIEKNKKFTC